MALSRTNSNPVIPADPPCPHALAAHADRSSEGSMAGSGRAPVLAPSCTMRRMRLHTAGSCAAAGVLTDAEGGGACCCCPSPLRSPACAIGATWGPWETCVGWVGGAAGTSGSRRAKASPGCPTSRRAVADWSVAFQGASTASLWPVPDFAITSFTSFSCPSPAFPPLATALVDGPTDTFTRP